MSGRRPRRHAAWLVVAVAGLAMGCARPGRNVVVLLPDADGTTGRVEVSNRGGSQRLDQPRQATRIRSADESPAPATILTPDEVERLVGTALAADPPAPARFLLYFQPASDDLAPESRAALPDVLRAAHVRPGADVTITGHTDTVGAARFNQALALRRAERVAELLRGQGLVAGLLTVRSHGEADPLVPTADEVAEPRNRRVEVTVR